MRLLHQTCAHLAHKQRFREIVPLAEKLVQIQPYDEKALRMLMRAYQAVGRRGAALAAYERFVALAADELGLAPESTTRDLAQSLRVAESPGPVAVQIAPDAEPDGVWARARQALDEGGRATLQTCLVRLRAQYAHHDERMLALEVDTALFNEDYARAEHLLAACDVQTPMMFVLSARLAAARSQRSVALDLASQALVQAGHAQDREAEL